MTVSFLSGWTPGGCDGSSLLATSHVTPPTRETLCASAHNFGFRQGKNPGIQSHAGNHRKQVNARVDVVKVLTNRDAKNLTSDNNSRPNVRWRTARRSRATDNQTKL